MLPCDLEGAAVVLDTSKSGEGVMQIRIQVDDGEVVLFERGKGLRSKCKMWPPVGSSPESRIAMSVGAATASHPNGPQNAEGTASKDSIRPAWKARTRAKRKADVRIKAQRRG